MRALRWHARCDIRVEEVPIPTPGPEDVVVRVRFCGICGTDLHEFADGPHLIAEVPHPLTGRAAPITLGHEIVGTIVDVGADVTTAKPGDRVVVEPCISCRTCDACTHGDPHHCSRLAGVGLAADGGFAELVAVPIYSVHAVPDAVPDEVAALAEPLAVALRALRRGGVGPATNLVVNGFGPIGAAVALWSRRLGARTVTVLEKDPTRRGHAESFGVDDVLAPDDRPLRSLGRSQARPDVIVDCTGVATLLPEALHAVAPGGVVVWTGIGTDRCDLAPLAITAGERSVVGALGHAPFDHVLAALADETFAAERLLTGIRPLAEAPGVFATLAVDKAAMKVLIAP